MDCENRIANLERELSMWRYSVIGMIALIFLVVTLGFNQKTPRVIEADQFVIRDDTGKVRMRLGRTTEDGKWLNNYGVSILDEQGGLAGSFYVAGNTPHLTLQASPKDAKELADAVIANHPEYTEQQKGLIRDVAMRNGHALSMFNSDGLLFGGSDQVGTTVGLSGITIAGGGLTVNDKPGGNERAVLGSTSLVDPKTGKRLVCPISTLTLLDESGRITFQAPSK